MERQAIVDLMNVVMKNRALPEISGEEAVLRDVNFRSLDFSELALRVENEVGRELNFDAAALRQITTVKDVVNFFVSATQ